MNKQGKRKLGILEKKGYLLWLCVVVFMFGLFAFNTALAVWEKDAGTASELKNLLEGADYKRKLP